MSLLLTIQRREIVSIRRPVGICLQSDVRIAQRCTPSRLQSTSTEQETLSWNQYLKIRRTRRTWQMAMTLPCAMLGLFGGISYFGSIDMDPTTPIMGIDPFMFYGMCTAGCMGAGGLIGPSIGSILWRAANRKYMRLFDVRDRQFFQHLNQRRVDPTLQTATNPIPDYYGEKIGNLKQYKRWLRNQAKYRRKHVFKEEE